MTARCRHCGVDYPEEILNPIVSTNGTTANICGICALEIINQAHGSRRKKFHGEIAEAMRQAALAHRRKLGIKA
jgi:hypothetical protein